MRSLTRRTAAGLIVATVVTPLAAIAAAPSKKMDVIELLEAEHRGAEALMNRILASGDAAERERSLRQLVNALTIHNANEENIVYPAIGQAANRSSDAKLLYHQQDDAKMAIWGLMQLPKNGSDFTTRFRELRTAILAHIHQEEKVDFPALRAALGSRIHELDVATIRLRAHWVADPA